MALLETISGPFTSVLATNHPATPFERVTPFDNRPRVTAATTSAAGVQNDGVLNLASGFNSTYNWLLLVPYADGGNPGEQFSMRLWGLRRAGNDSDPNRVVWINYLIGEYLCTLTDQPGPVPSQATNPQPILGRFLLPTENLCDTITVTHGNPGLTSIVTSPGSDAGFTPGFTGLTASILQECYGSQEVYFDFQPENGFTGTMNCFWSPA